MIIPAPKDDTAPAAPSLIERIKSSVSTYIGGAKASASSIISSAGSSVKNTLASVGTGAGSIVGGTVGAALAPLNSTLFLVGFAAIAVVILISFAQSATRPG